MAGGREERETGLRGGVALALACGAALVGVTGSSPPWLGFGVLTVLVVTAGAVGVTALLRRGAATRGRPERPPTLLRRLQVDADGGRRVVPASSIEWIEASGNYVRVHVAGQRYLYRASLRRLQTLLDGDRFLRVHRAAIVNLDEIERIVPLETGDAEIRLRSGARCRLSRRYAADFHERTGRSTDLGASNGRRDAKAGGTGRQ